MDLFRFDIRARLIAFAVSLAVLLMVVAGLVAYRNGSVALTDAAFFEMRAVAADKETAVSLWLNDAVSKLEYLAITPIVQNSLKNLQGLDIDSSRAEFIIRPLLAFFNQYAGDGKLFLSVMVLAADSGEVLTATDPAEIGEFKTDQPYFQNGRTGTYSSPPYFSETLQAPAKTISIPIQDEDGNLVAVVAARLNLERLAEVIVLDASSRQTRDAYLVTLDGLLVTQPRYLTEAAALGSYISTESVVNCVAGEEGYLQSIDYRGEEVVSAYRILPDEGLCLIVKMDQAEIREQVLAFGSDLAIPMALILVGAIAFSAVLANSFTTPIRELEEAATQIGLGKIKNRLSIHRKDELGRLAQQFNRMADSLEQQFAALETAREDLEIYSARLEENNRDLQEFAYVASHDLQEPLRKVMAFGNRLAERYGDQLGETGNDYVLRMQGASQRMQILLNDLLVYSRVSTRAQPFQELDLGETVADVVSDLSERIESTGGEVVINELPKIEADPTQMYQLMLNLISNALKFHKEGQAPIIEVSSSLNDGYCEVRVKDNGIGFDSQYLDRIFKPFQRLHDRQSYEGSGIGLAVCRRIVERHIGEITADSTPGEGSTFIVTLPVQQLEKGEQNE